LEFVSEVGGHAVLKPLDGAGGSGVVTLSVGDRNARSLVDIWTHEGKRWRSSRSINRRARR
jgi:glutathione synthase